MLASFRWLQQMCPVDAPVEELADRLSNAGLEIEAIHHKGRGLDGVVVAEVRGKRAHPKRDNLSLVTVFDGEDENEVVCGAPNVPNAGGRVLFARIGTTLPNGLKIEERKISGVVSRGMICSEAELDIGSDAEGIFVLGDEPGVPGAQAVDVLGLEDTILEVGLTPNRPDCLGHLGIAREIALLRGVDFVPPTPKPAPATFPGDLGATVEIVDGDRCPRYGAALVRGVTVGPSPFWLRYRLHNLGLRALSNVVDATNLILFEFGHPIHAFDLRHLRDSKIVVRLARNGETMATLDEIERRFTNDDLLICDGGGPVAVAGVMGGQDSEIRDDTKDVLIECAYFDPRSVRRTSRRLGLHTDSSHRFERGVDPNRVPIVLARSASLIAELAGGEAGEEMIDRVALPIGSKSISVRHGRIASLLGIAVPPDDTKTILTRVGCEITGATDETVTVNAPTWRPDLGREVDLIEEVARARGYDTIPTEVPRVHKSSSGASDTVEFVDRLRHAAANVGLYEAINYSFVSPSDLTDHRVPTHAVRLANPLSEERSVMRTSLLPGLLEAAMRAQRHGAGQVRLFELGRTFEPSGDTLPLERTVLAILLAGERGGWIGTESEFDFFDAKGAVEAILRSFVSKAPSFAHAHRLAFLHPKRSAEISLAGEPIGEVGELHPDIAEQSGASGRVVYAEISVACLWAATQKIGAPQAHELPRFPAVSRDIAMWVRDEFTAGQIADALREASGGLAESVGLFDLYRDDRAEVGRRSLAFRIVYRDPNETLTDKRVDKVHAKLGKTVRERFEATLR